MSAFPVKNFRQALEDTKSLQSKISKSFIIECKRHNMVWIEGITEEFYRIFSSKQNVKIKVNAMYGIQYFVQLAEYPIMTLFEVYILPKVLQIALFGSPNQTFETTSQYFVSQGYSPNTPNIKQLSHNYVILAKNFIFNCASIKPYRTFESNQMNEQSQYKKAVLKLNKAGIKQRDTNSDQIQQKQMSRQDFMKNLNKFDNDSHYYVSYYMKKVESFIMQGSKYQQTLDFKKIMKYGDVFLTSEAIGHCCQALENNNFEFKKNALLLIHDFVIWGDIEAIMMINYAEYIEEIFNHIAEVKGQNGLHAGQEIYPQIYGQKEQKKFFYLEFLKCLQTWAMAIPKTNFDGTKSTTQEDQQFSPVFLLYIKLKNQRQFKFPQNALLPKQKKQLQQSLLINKERNNLILRQLQQNAEDTLSVSKRSLKPVNKFQKYKSKNSLIKQQRQSSFVTSSEIQKYIKSAQHLMQQLLENVQSNNIDEAEDIMQKLNEFCNNFENKLEVIDQTINQEQLENLYREGFDRIERINCINDHFEDFKSEKINLMKLQELIKYELTKKLSQHTQSRYLDDFKSRKSKRSAMQKSYGALSQNMIHSKQNRSIQLKNFSHDKYRIPVDNSRHAMSKIAENLTEKESQSEVSLSTERNKKKNQTYQENEEEQQNQGDGSYDFQVQDYGFADVPAAQQNSNARRQSNKQSLKSSRKSIEKQKQKSRQSFNQSNSHRQSQKSRNIYTDNQKIQQKEFSNVKFSQASIPPSQSHQSIPDSQIKSQKKRISVTSQKQEQNNFNGKTSNIQSNFTKSKRLTQKSQSFMIASDNLKKLNQVSNMYSDEQRNPSVHHKRSSNKLDPNRSENLGYNPHKLLTSADPKELTSFNMTQIVGFSKAPPSSVNKISSIEQKKFKFEMLNSQDREIFEDELSKHSQNNEHKKLKQELDEDENPGFGIVFKNKSNIKNGKVEQFSKIKNNLQTGGQLRSKLSQNRRSSKQNSQIKENKKVPSSIKSPNQQKIPLVQRSHQKSLRRNEVIKTQVPHINIYTNPTHPKRESFRRKEEFSDSSLNRSESSRKSIRKSQRGSLIKKGLQGQPLTQRISSNNHPDKLSNNEYQSGSNIIASNYVTIKNVNQQREQFNQSSFIDSSQDTPKILQQSKNYYNNESYSQENQNSKLPIYLQKNTSPKYQKISFANSSRHNVLSKLVISQKDEKQEYDKSNLSPSQYRKSNQNTQHKFYQKDYQQLTKSKQKSVFEEEKVLKQKLETNPSQMKKKIQSSKNIEYLANKELEQIRLLKERLQKLENDSRYLMDFQRSTMKSPQMPRYAVSPRSPKFRQNNSSLSIQARQRVSFTNSSDFMSPQTKRNFDLNSSFSRQYLITPQGKLIKKANYEKYFLQLRANQNNDKNPKNPKNPKKRILRNKELIHKNENIQIGITILRQRNRLKIIYFITPEKPIQKFTLTIQPIKKLKIKCSQNEIVDMKSKSQQKIYINCQILEFPYLLPKIYFMYKNQKRTFYLGQGSQLIVPQTKFQMLLPVYFIKFIEIAHISSPQLSDLIQGRPVFRTEQFPLNSKFLKKPNQIHDYIPNLALLSETTAMSTYYGKGCFFNHNFIFKINFKMNHFVYIQGIPLQDNQKYKLCQNIIEWFMVCLQELFIKQIAINQ